MRLSKVLLVLIVLGFAGLTGVAYFGDMTVFHVRLDTGRTIKAASLNAVRKTENPLTYDERVWVSFDTDAGLVLTA